MKIGRNSECYVVKINQKFPIGFFPSGTIINYCNDGVYVCPPPPLDSMAIKYGQIVYKHLRYVIMANEGNVKEQ